MKLIGLILFVSACTAFSQTYYMDVHTKGGDVTSIPILEISKLTFSLVTPVENDAVSNIVKTFALHQNYPNPFNPTTTIEYHIPVTGNVIINIFNINGQLVRNLENGHKELGTHGITWDATNDEGHPVASGLYFYQVAFDNSILSRKMLFIK